MHKPVKDKAKKTVIFCQNCQKMPEHHTQAFYSINIRPAAAALSLILAGIKIFH